MRTEASKPTPLQCGRAVYSSGGPVRFSRYPADMSIAILVDGQRATVCLPEGSEPAGDNCVWLKGWSENEGMPEALELAGVVRLTGKHAPTGHVLAQHAELTPAAIEQFQREDPVAQRAIPADEAGVHA